MLLSSLQRKSTFAGTVVRMIVLTQSLDILLFITKSDLGTGHDSPLGGFFFFRNLVHVDR